MTDLAVIENNVSRITKDTEDQWTAINELRTRINTIMTRYVPVWVLIVMTGMGSITGAALTFAGMVLRMK